jgi:hypothetical protein
VLNVFGLLNLANLPTLAILPVFFLGTVLGAGETVGNKIDLKPPFVHTAYTRCRMAGLFFSSNIILAQTLVEL